MLTEKQLLERKKGIGGSDLHHVFNEPPYGCSRKLWYDKTSQEPDYPIVGKDIFDRGHRLEPIVVDLYREKYEDKNLGTMDPYHNPKYKWAIGNVDRGIFSADGKDLLAIFEAKTVGREVYFKFIKEGISTGYILQLQYYMWLANVRRGAYGILWADGWKFIDFEVERDDELIATIISACERFWKQVENGPPPDRLELKDKRCQGCEFRHTCQGTALIASVSEEGEEVPVMTELDGLMAEFIEFGDIKDEAEAQKNACSSKMKKLIGDLPVVDCTGYRIHYKAQESRRVKTPVLKKKYPEIYEECSSISVSRPFRTYSK